MVCLNYMFEYQFIGIASLFKSFQLHSFICLSGEVKITSVPKCEGEATANNRKGKLIFFYEWVITAEWTATLDDLDAAECNGTIDIPNLSEENEPHELDVS